MFTKLQFMCRGSTAPGTGTWPGDVTVTKDPTPALQKWRGMIAQRRHLGETQSWIQCQFCHGFSDHLDFITFDLTSSSIKRDALISLLPLLLRSYHKGQTCLRKPCHELERSHAWTECHLYVHIQSFLKLWKLPVWRKSPLIEMILLPLTPSCITHVTKLSNPSNEKTKSHITQTLRKINSLSSPEEQAMVPAQHFPTV